MSAVNYGRSSELKFVFVGEDKVLLVTSMITEDKEPYILWKEEKKNVEEIKKYIETSKKVENIRKEYNFVQVFNQVLTEKLFNEKEVEIISITKISEVEYIFIIYHTVRRIRWRIRGQYSE